MHMLVKFGCKEIAFNFLKIDSINLYVNRLLFFDFQMDIQCLRVISSYKFV
jgi:hypothetical protein